MATKERTMKNALIVILISAFTYTAHAGTESPYKGQEHRGIKSISQSDIDGYLKGKGMGFAKAAELNHYPGPRHVLDLSDKLELSNKQLKQTEALFGKMQAKAAKLGKQLVGLEKRLDQLFAQGSVSEESLDKTLQDIGATRAKLRYVHLSTHLEQKLLLSKHQIMTYDRLRGYGENGHSGGHGHNNSHNE